MKMMKKLQVSALAFAYGISAVVPALADDSEIYIGGVAASAAGAPNVLLLLDTSGSMKWTVTSSDTTQLDDSNPNQRMNSLKKAVERVLTTLPGNIRVGVARYNSDSNGGRIIYPLTPLDAPAGANADGSVDGAFPLSQDSDDAQQTDVATASTLDTSSPTLTIGSGLPQTFTLTANSDAAVECNTATAPSIYVGGSTNLAVTKGLYLGNHPVISGTTYCESSLGLRFDMPVGIPAGSIVSSAKLIFTHAGSQSSAPSGSTWGPTSNEALNFRVTVEDKAGTSAATSAATYSSTNGIKARSYVGISQNLGIQDDDFINDNATLLMDVTNLVQDRVANAGALPLKNVAFRVEGRSGNGSYTPSQTVCTKYKWNGSCSKWTTYPAEYAPKIRRIYGRGDDATKAPKLVVTYVQYGDAGSTAGVRFQGMNIPMGSTINSAYVEVMAAASAGGASTISVVSDNTSPTYISSLPFDTPNHLGLAARWRLPSGYTSNQAAWAAGSVYNIDVTSAMQAQISHANYCAGSADAGNQAMGFRFQLASGSARSFFSNEGSGSAPRLVVNYTPPSGTTCVRNTRQQSAGKTTNNYAVQNGTNTNYLGGNNSNRDKIRLHNSTLTAAATTCPKNCAAIRFPNVDVPKNAVITSATLKLVSSNSSSGTVIVKGIDAGDIAEFTGTNSGKVSAMLLTSQNTSLSVPANNSDKPLTLSNAGLISIVQTIVNNTNWARNNAMGLVLGNNADSGPEFYSLAKSSAYPMLVITYKSTDVTDGMYRARQDMIKTVNALVANGGTPLGETYYETALYMLGEPAKNGKGYGSGAYTESRPAMNTSNVYQSPVGEASCQSNNIVMLTDGLPSNDLDSEHKGRACAAPANIGTVAGSSNTSTSFDCMAATAQYLAETGRGDNGKIKTYTIGFGPVSTIPMASDGLNEVAVAGQGEYFAATSADALAATFQSIFARVSDSNGTMASPGVAVNQMNRTQHLDQLYYGVFKPQTTQRWPGNLKRYRLDSSAINVVDSLGAAAIDPATKYFSASAKSFWSADVDGNEATKGGAAGMQTAALKVYLDDPATNTLSVLNSASPPTGLSTDDVKWVQGLDSTGALRKEMGAPMHAQPVMQAVNSSAYTVYVGTNDGLLHAIDNLTGAPLWAWLPSDLKANVAALRADGGLSVGESPIYGVDGSWTIVDPQLGANKRLLVGGLRQGGSVYYGLEIDKNPAIAPTLKWALRPSNADFARLGHTWSQPQFAYVRISGTITPVLVFGGGLDYAKYETGGASATAGSGGDLGNAVYMINAKTGARIWWASSSAAGAGSTTVAALKYSVPGAVRMIDKNGDGLADHLYFGDMGGQVFRVDLDNTNAAPNLVKRVALLAQLGNAETTGKVNDRRFYEMPAVDYTLDENNKLYAAVAIGSGDRNFPASDKSTDERFYVIRDYDAARFDILNASMSAAGAWSGVPSLNLATYSAPFNHLSLADVSSTFGTTATTAAQAKKGWYIEMPSSGEKVLSSASIFSRPTSTGFEYQVNFNSFAPDSSSSVGCSPVSGATNTWSVLLKNGTTSRQGIDLNASTMDDRFTEGVAAGITGSGVPMIIDTNGDGQGDTLIELTGTGAQARGAIPPGLGKIQRTRWYDKRAN